ncbi:MAG: YggT family protein [Fimbriimonadia bacterium]
MIIGRVFMPFLFDPIYVLPLTVAYNALGLLTVTILLGVVLDFVQHMGGRVPYNGFTRTVERVSDAVTMPLKRFIRPVRMGYALLDLTPLVALICLSVLQGALRAVIGGLL